MRMPVVFIPHGGGPWPFVDTGFPSEDVEDLKDRLREEFEVLDFLGLGPGTPKMSIATTFTYAWPVAISSWLYATFRLSDWAMRWRLPWKSAASQLWPSRTSTPE